MDSHDWVNNGGYTIEAAVIVECKQLTLNPPKGRTAGPTNEENVFEKESLVMGSEGICFENYIFPAVLSFPVVYDTTF